MNVALISLHVKDPSAAHRFYTEVLGFASQTFIPDANLAIVQSADGGPSVLLEPSDNPVAKAYMDGIYNLGMPIIIFGTTDITADYDRLLAHGVTFSKTPTADDYGIEAVFDDTCGNFISLRQPK